MNDKYQKLVHAMQSGVAMEIEQAGIDQAAATPKHLRVGVNVALVESSALWKLLVEKGIITEKEMEECLLAAHKEEVDRYTARIKKLLGGLVDVQLH